MDIFDVGIIGGGASGLAAAVCAAREGASVLVLQRMDKAGKKILATGSGRCNLANRRLSEGARAIGGAYHCTQEEFPGQVLGETDLDDVLVFFASLGIRTTARDGYLYPASMQASSVRDALEWAVRESGRAEIMTNTAISAVHKPGRGRECFEIAGQNGAVYYVKRLILAAGGMSSPKLGSDGSGYKLAKALGHRLQTPLPALCPLICGEKYFRKMAGVRLRGRISIRTQSGIRASDEGELQLTAYGISGIPAFQVSRHVSCALARGQKVQAVLDFFPDRKKSWLEAALKEESRHHPSFSMEMILHGMMNSKTADTLCGLCGRRKKTAGEWTQDEISTLTGLLKGLKSTVTGTMGFEHSQVTAGGVDTLDVDPDSLASRIVPGLFLSGEILDVDGLCGGYNLYWAWVTGCRAGTAAARSVSGKTEE